MKCPVCKTECGQSNVCTECGFAEVGKDFINREEAEQWFNETVIPYRNNYHKTNIRPPIDWLEVFKQNTQAKHLFDFSIPVSIKRRTDIDLLKNPQDADYNEYLRDATLGHIAIVSTSDMIRKHFLDVITEQYLNATSFKRTVSNAVERASDLAAILTSLMPGEALVFEIGSKIKKDVAKLFTTSLSDFSMEITIGKGQGARSVRLDLPAFTTIFFAEAASDIPTEIANTLDAVIEFNPSQDELDELQIRETAPIYDVQLTKATLGIIKECNSQKTFKNVKGILKYISDYLYLHPEIKQPLSEDAIRNILETLGR